MKKIDAEILKNRLGAQREHYTALGVRAFYNIVFVVLILVTNYAVFAWACIALNAYFVYAAVRDLTGVIEEERRESKIMVKGVKDDDDRP